MIRSAYRAISGSWVTMMIVRPRRFRSASTSMIWTPVWESRLPVGSSQSRIAGSFTSARAIATRCCCPPESSFGRWVAIASSIPTWRRRSRTLPVSSFRRCFMMKGYSTFS